MLIEALLDAGFTRIGMYLNHVHLGLGKSPAFAENIIHCDNDPEKTQELIWTY